MLLPVVVVRRSVGSSDQLGALALWYLGLLGDTQSGGWDIVGWAGGRAAGTLRMGEPYIQSVSDRLRTVTMRRKQNTNRR
jgi:hypothetical protein